MNQVQPDQALWSRRGVLASALAIGATISPSLGRAAPLGRAARSCDPNALKRRAAAVSETEWRRLSKRLIHGRLLRPWDADFNLIALPNNMRYASTYPAGIARCGSTADVAAAIDWARQNDVPLATRGGGHSYAGFSTTEGLMIETTWMNKAELDPATQRIKFQGGARNRDLYRILRRHDLATTHGRCPSVGAAGFLLGGGIGFNMRAHGLGCDHLAASEIVLADGSVHRLDREAKNPHIIDLFWASRGAGGGNFGISTGFTLETFSVQGQSMTVFNLKWARTPENKGECKYSVEKITEALMVQLETAPPALGARISLGAVTPRQLDEGYDVSISLLGQYAGPRADLDKILRPVYDLCKPSSAVIKELPHWEAQDFLHEDGYPTYYQERSAFVKNAFGAEQLAVGFKHLRQWPGTCGYCDLRLFQTGAKVNALGPEETAFVHRDSRWLMVVGLYWSGEDNHDDDLLDRNHDWQDAFYHEMRSLAGGGAYQNFTDPSLVDYRESYYGKNLARLTEIKQRVDPDNLFCFPQEI